ncbi:hypothetical protein L211DRAFT_833206 [Terfezia boudieri ATCC MYA-4762]|uniref:UNC-45/Cro1/She4 central domain-containing protein n=1 Tax=Terfezia boudieri ATCC MYA-4762 TaxID=1051890 RepID=A0A3N4LZ69_9PEZI|nr:hypothetical protein L211DRAFT_833206 [Terfezia boudieri ATCC MYA-4762]
MTSTSTDVETEAAAFASSSLQLYSEGKLNDALRNLKHALSLSPRNPQVLLALHTLQLDSKTPEIVRLYRRVLVREGPEARKAGEDAVRYLNSTACSEGTAGWGECLMMLLNEEGDDGGLGFEGRIIAGLLRPTAGGGGNGAREQLVNVIRIACLEGSKELEELLRRFWSWGSLATEGFVSVLVDGPLWSEKGKTEEGHEKALKVCFRWFVGKIGNKGEGVQAAIRAISRILVAKTELTQHLLGKAAFEEILLAITRGKGAEEERDKEPATELATQATLAAAKYITAAGEPGEALLAEFMTQRLVLSESEEDNVIATEIAAALFPLIQQVAARIFTETEGLMERLVEVLDEGERPNGGEDFKQRAEALKAVVRLLGVACGEKACREVVRDRCVDYLERIVAQGYGGESQNDTRTLAAVALAKIHSAGLGNNAHGTQLSRVVDKGSLGELARIFKTSLILQSNTTTTAATSQQEAIEGLAYTSLDPSVKQALSTDHTFLTALLKTLSATTAASRGVLYGGLTVLANIAAYPPVLTEEQQKVLQLKKHAEANPSASTDSPDIGPLETDEAVTGRCKKLLDAGIVPVLVAIFKNLSQTSSIPPAQAAIATAGSSLLIISTILLSVSKTQKYRPQIAQQGGVKLLLQIYSAVTAKPISANNTTPSNAAVAEVRYTTAHALARILVSVNPTLIFSQIPPASAIRPLLALLNTRYDDGGMPAQRGPGGMSKVTSLLPTFEALLALTNLASMSSDGSGGGIQDLIVRVGWDQLEDVLLSYSPRSSAVAESGDDESDDDQEQKTKKKSRTRDTADAPTRIQRAAVELICNLCGSYSSLALEKFAASPQSDPRVCGRLHLLLALADAEDYPTRRAAAGTLAVLTEFETVVEGVLARERGVKVLLGMLEDEDDQGEEMAMRGLVCVRNLLGIGGDKAVERVKVEGGREGLVQAVKRARGKEVVELGVEAVKMLI